MDLCAFVPRGRRLASRSQLLFQLVRLLALLPEILGDLLIEQLVIGILDSLFLHKQRGARLPGRQLVARRSMRLYHLAELVLSIHAFGIVLRLLLLAHLLQILIEVACSYFGLVELVLLLDYLYILIVRFGRHLA